MKKLILVFTLSIISLAGFSQKVKFKKEVVSVDDKEILTYERGGVFGAVAYELSELGTKKRIITLVQNNGGTHMELSDDYIQIKFLTLGKRAEIKGGDLRDAIKLLLKNEVLTSDGKLDESKVELFIQNYDEKISERTIIKG